MFWYGLTSNHYVLKVSLLKESTGPWLRRSEQIQRRTTNRLVAHEHAYQRWIINKVCGTEVHSIKGEAPVRFVAHKHTNQRWTTSAVYGTLNLHYIYWLIRLKSSKFTLHIYVYRPTSLIGTDLDFRYWCG